MFHKGHIRERDGLHLGFLFFPALSREHQQPRTSIWRAAVRRWQDESSIFATSRWARLGSGEIVVSNPSDTVQEAPGVDLTRREAK